jgi:structural maintenance of chromosome 4
VTSESIYDSTAMPPRRSSRSASASLQGSTESAPVKRKREQTAESVPNEEGIVSKPPPKTRRGSRSTAATTSKSSNILQSKKSLPDIVETDTGEQADAPPLKKARPSAGADVDEGIKVEEVDSEGSRDIPKRGRRAASATVSRPVGNLEIDEGVPSKTRRRTSARTSVSRKLVDDEVKDIKPEDSEDDDDKRPRLKGRKAKSSTARKTSSKAVRPVLPDGSDDELEPPPPAQPKPASSESAATQEPVPNNEEEQEEEKSLFEPPVSSSLSQCIPEEPSVPKARLVIHKMALVNFKSYAGRQEIGPFHKVLVIFIYCWAH